MTPQEVLRALQAGEISLDAAREKLAAFRASSVIPTKRYGLVVGSVMPVSAARLTEWDVGPPAATEIMIEVRASSVNFPDTLCIQGLYPTMPEYPFVPGFEVSGVVATAGLEAPNFRVGDEVIALTGARMGGHASYVNVPAANVIRKPANTSFEDACSLPVVFSTVYHSFEIARLGWGEHVLIQSAAGGCGLMALQLANLRQSICYGTSRKDSKLEFLKGAGFAHAINYKTTDFESEIKRLTANRGVDVVLNTLAGDALQKGINCLAPFGRYLELAVQALKSGKPVDLSSLVRNQSVYSIDLRRLGLEKGFDGKAALEIMVSMLEAREIVPIVSRVYPIHQIGEALEYVSAGHHVGKVVISHTSKHMEDRTRDCAEALREQKRRSESRVPRPAPVVEPEPERIAIIGMAGRFPKSPDLDAFWKNIADGVDCISEVPAERWPIEDYFQAGTRAEGKSYSKWMGVLDDAEQFDPMFFNISPAEAERMDPQQRLFLEASWHCIEDAAIRASTLSGSRCGVFVGCGPSEYGRDQGKEELNSHALMGGATSILAARISYFLNLKGPSLAIEAACSSSLVAIAQACDSLLLGTSDLALAGGVHVMFGPAMHVMTSNAGMLSDAGRCFVFDDRANGFVPGEGVGVILLKRLSDAIRAGDRIAGIIRGWGVNQDGRTNGITAPSAKSQAALEADVYRRSRTNPETITLVEAHGTGTALGDPIEVEALTEAFGAFAARRNYCALGSVKSNIGHLMTGSGIAGVIKVLLALQHKMLPPTIHFQKLNPHIAMESSPFYVNTRLQPWTPEGDVPRRACVSSFGFSGTNAHMVIEEFVSRARPVPSDGPVLITLSAHSEAQLKAYARRLRDFIRENETLDLRELAYTLQTGREAMEHRLAAVIESRQSLIDALGQCIDGVASGSFTAEREVGELKKIAEAWLGGSEVDWNLLYPGAKPNRRSIPGYPFQRRSYSRTKSQASVRGVLHPLVHRNTSDLRQQCYTSEFSGTESFLNDHRVRGAKVLPGSAILEMARFAVQDALGGANGQLSIRDIVWIRRCVVSAPTIISIRLTPDGSGAIAFEISEDDRRVYCRGRAMVESVPRAECTLAEMKSECTLEVITGTCFYQGLDGRDFQFGPSHRAIQNIFRGKDRVLAELALPDQLLEPRASWVLHPGMLDSALQAAALACGRGACLPFALDKLTVFAPTSAKMWAYVRFAGDSGTVRKSDIDLLDESGAVCVSISGFSMRPWNEGAGADPMIFRPIWARSELSVSGAPDRIDTHLVVFCETAEVDRRAVQEILGTVQCLRLQSSSPGAAERYREYFEQLLQLLQSLQRGPKGHILLQLIGSTEVRLILKGLAGLLKTAQLESGRLVGQVLEVEALPRDDELLQTLRSEAQDCRSREVRYSASERFVASWEAIPWTADAPCPWEDGGVYVITGGAGSIGLHLAREIAQRVAGPKLVLAGRSASSPEIETELNGIRDRGASVTYHRVDISDSAAASELIGKVHAEHGRVTGVIHAAGIVRDNYIHKKTVEECREVFAPKVAGAIALDLATRNVPVDLFLIFSSVAGALGNAGQADYASANAFLDAFAAERAGRTVSINWPLWRDGGMKVDEATAKRMEDSGWEALETAPAFRALDRCVASGESHVLVASGDRERIHRMLLPGSRRGGEISLRKWPDADGLRKIITGLLKIEEQDVDGDTEWSEFGFDSISLTDFAGHIAKKYGIELTPAIFFEHPTLNGLAAFLNAGRPEQRPEDSPDRLLKNSENRLLTRAAPKSALLAPDAVAVIGMSGRFPHSPDLDAFWQNLVTGRDCIEEIPATRWDWRAIYGDPSHEHKTRIKYGGFIEGVDEFDPLFFGISPAEAEWMDPQQRLLMMYVWRAIEDSGHAPGSFAGTNTAIFAATGVTGYGDILQSAGAAVKGYSSTGSVPSLGPNRISFLLDLHGPSEPVETACSSSLVAVHKALMAINAGLCDTAIVGGVNTILTPEGHIGFDKAGMLSQDGRCKTFSDRADGYVRGEGVAVLILKRLELARRDGDHIYGLLRGSAENHGGRATSLTAPNTKAQAALLEMAYTNAGVDPRTITYVEAHGTGTALGDPVEVNALKAAFGALHRNGDGGAGHCGIGSVKSNIGHLELAAGLAGMVKVLLQLRHKTLVKTLHCESINPYIDLQNSPFYVVNETQPWAALKSADGNAIPRRAGVSSFGFGGVNAHVVVEEYDEVDGGQGLGWKGPALVVLSARNNGQLREQAQQLLAAVDRESWSDDDLPSIAYTLQAGRDAMEERLGVAAATLVDLKSKLTEFVLGKTSIENSYYGDTKRMKQTLASLSIDDDMAAAVANWIAKGKYGQLLDFWTKGGVVPWDKLYGADKPKRLSLPAYPFARERYWPVASRGATDLGGHLHPLLHRNTSDLSAQRFTSTFSGSESFLADHIVQGRKTLPAAVYLEMARAAFDLSSGQPTQRGKCIRIRDVVWLLPVVAAGPAFDMHVTLIPESEDRAGFTISTDAGDACRGTVESFPVELIPQMDLARLRAGCGSEPLTAESHYRACEAIGLVYGPAHRTIRTIYRGTNQLLAEIASSETCDANESLVLNPGRVDGALQSIIGLYPAEGGSELRIPFALGVMDVFSAIPSPVWAWIRPAQGTEITDRAAKFDLDLLHDNGRLCARIQNFAARAVRGEGVREEAARAPQVLLPVERTGTNALVAILTREISTILRLRTADLDADSEFTEFGFDSITLTEFAAHLNSTYSLEIPPTLFFECPTIRSLAGHLAERYAGHFGPGAQETPVVEPVSARQRATPAQRRFTPAASDRQIPKSVAIIGMSGRFPMAADLEEFWQNLVEGRDCIQEIPESRWDWRRFYGSPRDEGNKTNIKWGGFVDGVDEFDPLFFGISPAEAELMDPQQRLLMIYAWRAIEDAGYAPHDLSGTNTGIFVGTGQTGYGSLIDQARLEIKGYSSTGSVPSVGPNRLSYFLNLRGPSEPVETACSSSLVALHRAIAAIREGECDMAIAGGVNTIVTPAGHIAFNQAGMLSEDGRCKAFSADANGYVRGEGVGILLLKDVSRAEADGDHIYGIIRGSAVNHGGRTASLTAPSPRAQAELLVNAYRSAGVAPETVTYIEAHGTGTPLGDPIEIDGLKSAFAGPNIPAGNYCGLGSVKSNIGHLELAAGVAGVIKVLLQFQHKTLVKTLHCDRINPHIALENTPFYIVREPRPWEPLVDASGSTLPRRAGVSSFGFGGVNAHVVLEEYNPVPRSAAGPGAPYAIVLSARNESRLKESAEQLLRALQSDKWEEDSLCSIAYTLQTGREAMDERLGFLVSSIDEMRGKLSAFVQGKPGGDFFHGQVKRNREIQSLFAEDEELQAAIGKWIERRKFTKLLDLWTRGATVDWRSLYDHPVPSRVSLPTYPFAREKYWVPATSPLPADTEVLHPLLHRNLSDFDGQRYGSTFAGQEFFLRDHVVRGERIFPAVAYLEMARAAVDRAVGTVLPAQLILRNVVWLHPFVVLDRASHMDIRLRKNGQGEIEFEFCSDDSGTSRVHARGSAWIGTEDSKRPVPIDVARARAACPDRRSSQDCYERFASMGLAYGPTLRGLEELFTGPDEVLARVSLPAAVAESASGYVVHPSVADAALQACLGMSKGSGGLGVPFALDLLEIWEKSPRNALVTVARCAGAAPGVSKLNVTICDEQGDVRIRMSGLSFRSLPQEVRAHKQETRLLRPVWKEAAVRPEKRPFEFHRVITCGLPGVPANSVLQLHVDSELPQRRFTGYAGRIFAEIKSHIEGHGRASTLFQIVIRGDDRLLRGLAGLAKTARLEQPDLGVQVIEFDADSDTDYMLDRLRHAAATDHSHIIYRADRALIQDWETISNSHAIVPWRDHGVYLVTGGAGGLGRILAQEIASAVTKRTIILAGRSTLRDEELPAGVEYHVADAARDGDLTALLESILRRFGKLNGIIHAAGLERDNYIRNKSLEEFEEVLSPKVTGLVNLDEASKEINLDFFVLFSSLAGVFGNAGQSDYAAANAFLDAYADYRNELVSAGKRRGKTLSVNWPYWRDGGMTLASAGQIVMAQTTGLEPLQTHVGLDALYRALSCGESQVVVVCGKLDKIEKTLFRRESRDANASAEMDGHVVEELQASLRKNVGELLKVDVNAIESDCDLSEYGLDSITLTELTSRLNQIYGLNLTPTVFFELPTIRAVAEYLVHTWPEQISRHFGPVRSEQLPVRREAGPVAAAATVAALPRSAPTPIAIVGMSGRFPKAPDLDTFWENLAGGVDCITEVPESRWNWREYYGDPHQEENKTKVKWGGFIDGVDEFDPLFFGIPPSEAEVMDPQQRLLMQYIWGAIEDAGYAPRSLAGTRTGIFVATGNTGYSSLLDRANLAIQGYSSAGAVPSIGPNRMSYLLDLHGPSEPIETACSSSLVAIHRAMEAIQSGSCDMAIVGGVNTIVTPGAHIGFDKAGMLAQDGRCKTFDQHADGYVRGEGVGMLFLKRLSDAEDAGDSIYGVIRSSAENHGGRAKSLTAPNPKAQADLIRSVYSKAGVDPRTVGYIEAHGTGTQLGDPIEIDGLKTAFEQLYEETGGKAVEHPHCGIASVKSNIGHLELAAGVAGVIKVLLQLKHKTLVKTLHCETVNAFIKLEDSPFFLVREQQEWAALRDASGQPLPRRAGVSSFGFGGVNAHVLIEEYVPVETPRPPLPRLPLGIVLSARTAERLEKQAANLLGAIRKTTWSITDLGNLAFTLQVGRDAMEERLAVIVDSAEALDAALQSFLNGNTAVENLFRGRATAQHGAMASFAEDESLSNLVQLWVRGAAIDWNKLDRGARRHRIHLPTYPFAQNRYWVPAQTPMPVEPRGTVARSANGRDREIPSVMESLQRRIALPSSRTCK